MTFTPVYAYYCTYTSWLTWRSYTFAVTCCIRPNIVL
jgi:hypothetical protein